MTILTKLSALVNSAIELPCALHACVEMAREADYSRHEMARLPSELNEELEQKQSSLDLWRSWAANMSGLDDDAPSWQLRDEIKRKLADDDGTQICGRLAARIVELERELKRWHSWAQLRFHVTSENCDDLRRLIEYEENNMLSHEHEACLVERFIGDERWAWARERIKRLQDDLSNCETARAMEKIRRVESGLRLARIRDAELIRRYHRTVEMGGECYGTEPPSGVDVLFRDCSGDKPGPWQFGAVPTYGKFEWRYLSPEDMPDNQ